MAERRRTGSRSASEKASETDSLWKDATESAVQLQTDSKQRPKAYRLLELDRAAMTQALAQAPLEFSDDAERKSVVITLPVTDGRLWQFRVQESPVMTAELAARFPEIKTYSGQGIDDPTATMRLSLTPGGLNAFIISEGDSFMVSPYSETDSRYYMSFSTRDVEGASFECQVPGLGKTENSVPNKLELAPPYTSSSLTVANGTLREYRMSFAVTQQFYQHFGGPFISPANDVGVVAAINTYVNNVNVIYERDIAVRFKFHSWIADRPGYCYPAANCFPPNQDPSQMMQPNQFLLDNLFPGAPNYDVGSALGYSFDPLPAGYASFGSGGADGAGGACENSFKGQSAIRLVGTTGNYLSTLILAHEWGHMFGARHTFSSSACPANQLERVEHRVEPGSGSTIMSYAPVCPPENLFTGNPSSGPDSYFHIHSLLRIANHKERYSNCGQSIATGNTPPAITNGGTPVTIPALTPFTLTAAASDPNGDALTYAWEEWDPGATLFRSYRPTTSPSRTFPNLTYILNYGNFPPTFLNGFLTAEVLSGVTRPLFFTVTVRDNRSGGGTSARDTLLQINVVGGTGPFKLTQPNTPLTLSAANPTTVTWNVAGTNLSPISTSSVRILLSSDGGNTFPTVLANSTPNDGSETVTLPGIQTSTARIKVEAVGNIYFDVSDTNFSISNNTPNPSSVQLSTANLSAGEADGRATITVTRTGNTTGAATVNYRTADTDTFTVGCADTSNNGGGAFARCDFATSVGAIQFAPGEMQKSITVPIIDDGHAEGAETFQFILSGQTGANLGTPGTATVTILDNDAAGAANPVISSVPFFVRQQYLDFLSREPDQNGFNAWLGVLNGCGNIFTGPNVASGCDRIYVSGDGFFRSVEFQLKGFYVFRFYRVAFNRLPEYLEVVSDMSLVAGQTAEEVYARKAQLATLFTERQEFQTLYGGLTNAQYVAALLNRYQLTQITTFDPANPDGTAKVTLTSAELTARLNANTLTRAQVLRAIADSDAAAAREVNNAFVGMQYYGYLRRKPDQSGFDAWLAVLQSGNGRTMVNGFLNSTEYKLRFGQP